MLWILRKMVADGFIPSGCDGHVPQGGLWKSLPRPLEVAGVRPDAFAVAPSTGEYAFGEAKTAMDINTPHTRKQLTIFGRLHADTGKSHCRLYIAVPRSSAPALDRVLAEIGLIGAKHVVRLHIPDCLVAEQGDACA